MWAFDEHRLGLKPVLRRQWAPKGQRPIAVGRHRYEWLYLYGFVHPGTGEVVWFICTTVDAELLSAVLAALLALPVAALFEVHLGRIGFLAPLPFVVSWTGVALWTLLVLVASLLASWLPARRAANISVREAIAHV